MKIVETVGAGQALGLAAAFTGVVFLLGAFGWWPNPVLVLTAARPVIRHGCLERLLTSDRTRRSLRSQC